MNKRFKVEIVVTITGRINEVGLSLPCLVDLQLLLDASGEFDAFMEREWLKTAAIESEQRFGPGKLVETANGFRWELVSPVEAQ